MPEAPDLEAYAAYLAPRLAGHRVVEAKALVPPVVKAGRGLLPALSGREVVAISRLGKHLRLDLSDGPLVLVHPMLTGRFHLVPREEKRRPRTALALAFDHGLELRLWDERLMSRVYVLAGEGEVARVLPPRPEQGPDALDPALTPQALRERLRGQRSQIKALMVSEKLVSGIGNAYADEVLFAAGISPFRKGGELGEQEVERLFQAMREVLNTAAHTVLERMEKEGLPDEEYRDHMQVHRRGGQPCPRCRTPIAETVSGGRVTSYCPRCQA